MAEGCVAGEIGKGTHIGFDDASATGGYGGCFCIGVDFDKDIEVFCEETRFGTERAEMGFTLEGFLLGLYENTLHRWEKRFDPSDITWADVEIRHERSVRVQDTVPCSDSFVGSRTLRIDFGNGSEIVDEV